MKNFTLLSFISIWLMLTSCFALDSHAANNHSFGKSNDAPEYLWQHPSINSNEINVIHHVTNDLVYAAGVGGMVLKSEDGGETWTELATPFITNITDMDVHGTGPVRLVAAGPGGFLATSDDGGTSWTIRSPETTNNLLSVAFVSENHLIAVGASKTILQSNDFGVTWTSDHIVEDSVFNPNNRPNWAYRGLAVTATHIYTSVDGGGMPIQVLRSADNGVTWQSAVAEDIPVPGATIAQRITGLSFSANGQIGYGVAHSGFSGLMVRTTDGGTTWNRVIIGDFTNLPNPDSPHSYATVYPFHGVSVSADGTKIVSVANFGQTLASIDSGENWFEIYGGHLQGLRDFANVTLYGASIAPNDNWLVAGRRGIIAGADNYTAGNAQLKNGVEENIIFTGITFTDDLTGFAAGYRVAQIYTEGTLTQSVDHGVLYTTADGGATWNTQTHADLTDGYRWHAVTSHNNHIWLAGENYVDTLGVIKYSADNGLTWTTETTNEQVVIDIASWDSEYVYAVTRGTTFLTRNADGTWVDSELPQATATRPALTLEVVAPKVVFVGGGATSGTANTPFILKTEDGGQQWATSFNISGAGLVESINFMDGAFGIAGGQWGPFNNRRNILVTYDYGQTWTAPDVNFSGANNARMYYFHLANSMTARAYGANGHIVSSTNPEVDFVHLDESPTGNNFNAGYGLNANNAWLVGENSTIIKFESSETVHSAPAKFANLLPAPGDAVEVTLEGFTFSWSAASDPDGGEVTYQFILESLDGETSYLDLDAEGQTSITLFDTDFTDIPDGTYSWRVVAETSNNQQATTHPTTVDIAVVELDVFALTFTVEDADGDAIADAVITLNGETNLPGIYEFLVLPGTYEYTVNRDGFHNVEGNVEVTDSDVSVGITMISSSVIISEYHWQYPSINSNEINVIKHISSDQVIAAGVAGLLMRSDDGGSNWEVIGTPFTNTIADIAFFQGESLNLAVAGPDGFIATSHNGGLNWTIRDPEITNNLLSIEYLNSNTLVALGANKTFLVSENSGATWVENQTAESAVLNPNNRPNWIFREPVVTPGYLYVTVDGGGMPMQVLRSANNGQTWEAVLVDGEPTPGSFTAVRITGISFAADGQTGFATGTVGVNGRIAKTTNAGTTWEIVALGDITPLPNPDVPFQSTSLPARQTITVSSDGSKIISGGNNGLVVASIDSGESWFELYGGPRQGLRDLWATQIFGSSIGPDDSWLVAGQRGIIAGSSTFTAGSATLKNGDDQRKEFTAIVFTDSQNGFATGYRIAEQYTDESGTLAQLGIGLFYSTADGGQTWTPNENALVDGYRWYAMAKDGENNLWVAGQVYPDGGGVIKSSTDNGQTWVTEITVDQPVVDIAVWDENHIYAVTEGDKFIHLNAEGELVASELPEPVVLTTNPALSVEVVSPDVVFVGGGRTLSGGSPFILKSTDGGTSWSQVFSMATGNGMVSNIQFMDGAFGLASGMWGPTLSRINILVTTDYGQTWSAPELTYDGANHARINHFHIANALDVTAYGISGHILRTVNEALDFHYIDEKPTRNVFNSGYSLNANNAWLVGENSTIIRFESLDELHSAPAKFANMEPAPGEAILVTPEGYTFTWSASTDPDGGDVSYQFILESLDGETIFLELDTEVNEVTLYDTQFDDIPEGEYQWRVVAETLNNQQATTYPTSVDITVGELELFTVTFAVEDSEGNPIADAVITFDNESYPEGVYQFDVLPGTYDYTIIRDGYHDVTGDVIVTDDDVTITINMELITYELLFVVEDEDGAPIADAIVTLDGQTFDAGEYQFDLTPGTYDYTVSKAGYHPEAGQVVIADEDQTEIVILNLITYELTFVVEDENGVAIPDAIVTIDGETYDAGVYQFNLIPGTYEYTVAKEGYHTASGQVIITDDDVSQTVTLVLITYQLTFMVEDENGDPVPDANVSLDGETHSAGTYQFELVPGTYNYSVSKPGYHPVSGQVTITDDDVTVNITLSLITYLITFQVEDPDGNAIADAVITLDDEVFDAGVYQFEVLPGTYDYHVYREGYTEASGEIVVTDDDVVVNVTIQSTVNVPVMELQSVRLYPNPASTILLVDSDATINELRVFDLLGQMVYAASVENHTAQINVSDWKNGVYLIQILTSNGMETHRVQVSH
jgi:photosystem II stability/assembly factor-like uncharacterized protein